MPSAEALYTKRIVKNGIVNLRDLETGLILIQNRPATMELDDGLGGNTEITEIDSQGYEVKIANNFKERKPTVNLTFRGLNLDIVAFQRNRKTHNVTATLKFPWRQQVLKAEYDAAPTGKLGNGMIEDATTLGSTLTETGETVALTQQPYASFNSATVNSFAIGADYARRFSDDLVTRRGFVILEPEKEFSTRTMSEETLGYLELNALCFNSDDSLEILVVPQVFVNPEGSGFKPGDDTTSVALDVATIGRCEPWELHSITDEIFCDD